jgi:pantothenate synthetase
MDYLEIIDTENLDPLNKIDDHALVAVAAFVGTTRLIDNFVLLSESVSTHRGS